MTKGNIKIKDSITIEEKAIITEYLTDSYFVEDEYGVVRYTPYNFDPALVTAFFLYCVEGIEFETKESDNEFETEEKNSESVVIENVYEAVSADDELMNLYSSILSTNTHDDNHPNIKMIRMLHAIVNDVSDMVEFRKQQIIHNNPILVSKLYEILEVQEQVDRLRLEVVENENTVLLQQINENSYGEEVMKHMSPEEIATLNKKILDGDMDYNRMADLVVQKYLGSDEHSNIVEMKTAQKRKPGRPKKMKATNLTEKGSEHGVNN